MTETINQPYPKFYQRILDATEAMGFTMASDLLACSLLRTLAASKTSSKFLELGTGTGLSTSWILDGMDESSDLTSVDYDKSLLDVARNFLGSDRRLTLVEMDGADWVNENRDARYDYIFADTWHGKYLMLDEVMTMLNRGGLYIIDDMLPQPNWPDGHHEKATKLLSDLDERGDLVLTRLAWSTGIVVAVKK